MGYLVQHEFYSDKENLRKFADILLERKSAIEERLEGSIEKLKKKYSFFLRLSNTSLESPGNSLMLLIGELKLELF